MPAKCLSWPERERLSFLEDEFARLRSLVPEGVTVYDWLRHLTSENKDLREQRGADMGRSEGWE